MFEDVLIPTDGSDCADVAVQYAEDLAAHYGATVHALCVVDSRSLENVSQSDRRREASTEIAERTCNELAEAGLPVERAVRTDVPHQAILEYVTEHGVDLIVMGTHGRTGVERYLLGSVTEKVVRLSDVPVLTVKTVADGEVTYPYSNILVPTDGSEGAVAAIAPAVGLASTYDARLHALSAVDTMAMGFDVRSDMILDTLEETARAAVEKVESMVQDAGLPGFRSLGVRRQDFDLIAEKSARNGSNADNPRPMKKEDYLEVLERLYSRGPAQ